MILCVGNDIGFILLTGDFTVLNYTIFRKFPVFSTFYDFLNKLLALMNKLLTPVLFFCRLRRSVCCWVTLELAAWPWNAAAAPPPSLILLCCPLSVPRQGFVTK